MSEEFVETDADVTEVPASTDAGGSAEAQPETPTGDQPEGGKPADAQPSGFSSLFGAAKEKASALGTEDADGDEPEGGDEPDGEAEPEKDKSDEKVPDEGEEETDEEKAAKAEKDGDKDAKPQGRERGRNYKEIVEENTRLVGERDTATAKVEKLNGQLEKYGGMESVEIAMEIFDKLATGKVDEVIAELPAHQRNAVQKQIFEGALTEHANRVFGINHVLTTDFGLEKAIEQPMLEKILEFATYRLNGDSDDFESFLDRELEFANTPERELARVRAENERLKNKPADDATADEAAETPEQFQTRIQTTHDAFEDATFERFASDELKAYGLEVTAKDTPAIKEAKEILRGAIKTLVGVEMRTSKAFEPLLPFWIPKDQSDTEKLYYKQAVGTYERAMKAKLQTTLKKVSKLFVGGSGGGGRKPDNNPQIPASGQNGSNITPPPAKKPGEGGGFSTAFNNAKKNAGAGS